MSDAPPPPAAPPGPASPHAVFSAGKLRFALPITAVGEVVNDAAVTRVPHCTKGIMGLINLRGDIVPAASLDPWFGETRSAGTPALFLVVRNGAAQFALRIDKFEQVAQVPDAAVAPDPAPGAHTNVAPRVWNRAPGDQIRCLNPEAIARALQLKKPTASA
ncbi:MAG: chemotaxis protein CheW [Verrucomicrobia bacterium]|nr:chemotaxis protein CheW [Verrucomicrobiota bacterium]